MKFDRGTLPITAYDSDSIPLPYSWREKKKAANNRQKSLTVAKFKKAVQMLEDDVNQLKICKSLHLSRTVVSQIKNERITLITDEDGTETIQRDV